MRTNPVQAAEALDQAVQFHKEFGTLKLQEGVDRQRSFAEAEIAVLLTAETFLSWLDGTTSIQVEAEVKEQPVTPVSFMLGKEISVQLTDTQEADVTVSTADAKGFMTSDLIEYDNSDTSVCEVIGATDEDSHTATIRAVSPGTALVTLTDNAVEPPLTAAVAVTVTAGPTTQINVAEGTPREQTP